MCESDDVMQSAPRGEMPVLSRFGAVDTCKGVMRAYALYRYNLFKEKYEKHERDTG